MSELQPVAPPERVAILDVLRGGALFGVLASNVYMLFSTRWLVGPADLDASTLDGVAAHFVELVIAGKAMTLLTFLFGLGFAMQLVRADERGEDARPLFVRRLAALFLIGACHVTFLWWGDVTWTYAVAGFALLAFRRTGPRALLAWSFVLVLVPHLVASIPEVGEAVREVVPRPANPRAFRAEMLAAVHGTDYGTLIWAHVRQRRLLRLRRSRRGTSRGSSAGSCSATSPASAGLFDGDGAAHLPLFRRLLAWGLAVGLAGAAMRLLLESSLMADVELLLPARLALGVLFELSTLGLTAAYASIAVLLLQRPPWRRVLLVLAPVGRMPLTTYLVQSVAATFVFYGWGLDRAGRLGAAGCLGVSIVIFALEIAAAHLWLRRFRFGPAEWLWRSLAYGRRPPMRG